MFMSADQENRLLGKPHQADRADLFANDTDPEIRRLGRLALRRDQPDISDYFELGDLCAIHAIDGDALQIDYLQRASAAYQRALALALRYGLPREETTANQALESLLMWAIDVARAAPSVRNLAAALWLGADRPISQHNDTFRAALIEVTKTALGTLLPDPARQTLEMPAALPNRSPISTALDLPSTAPDSPTPTVPKRMIRPTEAAEPISDNPHTEVPLQLLRRSAPTEPLNADDLPADDADWLDQNASNLLTVSASPRLANSGADADDDNPTPSSGFRPSAMSTHDPSSSSSLPSPAFSKPQTDAGRNGNFRINDVLDGRYVVHNILGGGMGVIYVCFDQKDEKLVALKTFKSELLNDEAARRRFHNEADIWIRLDKHPNIVWARKVITVGGTGVPERPHIVMEYIAPPEGLGPDLRSWIEHRRLTPVTALEMSIGICNGMLHATQRIPSLVHRDMKPGNILVRHDGIAKVTDFGLGRARGSLDTQELGALSPDQISAMAAGLTRPGRVMGTLQYMAPEQTRGDVLDVRADIFAFGAILYEMLTNKRLYPARDIADLRDLHRKAVEFPPEMVERLPADLREVVAQCLAYRKEDRYKDWLAILEALSVCYTAMTGAPPPIQSGAVALAIDDLMDKAYSFSELKRNTEAITIYDEVISLAPDSNQAAWVWARKGRVLRILGKDEDSLACFERAIRLRPGFAWAWYGKAIAYERLKQPYEALKSYEQASKIDPHDAWISYNHARLLFRLNYPDEALERVNALLDSDTEKSQRRAMRAKASLYTLQGEILLKIAHPQDALNAFDTATQIEPTFGEAWVGRGMALSKLARKDEAISTLMRASQLIPTDVSAWLKIADAHINAGDTAAAIPPLEQASRIRPQYRGVWLRLGYLYSKLHRHADAIVAYDKALEIAPNDPIALGGKGAALSHLREHEAAAELLDQAIQSGRVHSYYRLRLAEVLMALRRFEDAVNALEAIVQRQPTYRMAWLRLGKAYLKAGARDRAVAAFDRVLESNPRSAWAWSGRGVALRAIGELDEALRCFQKASELAPDQGWHWYHAADLLSVRGEYEAALAALNRWTQKPPPDVAVLRGHILRRQGRLEAAVQAYEEALSQAPNNVWAHNGRGLALDKLRQRDEAIEAFEKAIEGAPRVAWFRLNAITPLLATGRREEALDLVEDGLNIGSVRPDEAAALWTRKGDILRAMYQHPEALSAYDQAIVLAPEDASAWEGIGMAHAALGHHEQALAALQRAADLSPNNARIWYNIGDVLVAHGSYQEAISSLNKALQLKPSYRKAQLKRDEARAKLNPKH